MKAIKIAALVSFIVIFVVTILFFSWWAMKDRIVFGNEKFDQVKWMTAGINDKACHRGDMAYDLQQHVLHPGMAREATTILLGRPTWEDVAQSEYDLGSCMHVIHGLRLFFDGNHRLTHSRIVQH